MIDHWKTFAEFAEFEIKSGGPDPQLTMIQALPNLSWEEHLWRAGCYAAFHNFPSAEAIWKVWPWPRIVEEGDEFLPWVRSHWAGLSMRTERRCVRTPEKLTAYFRSYANWLPRVGTFRDYEQCWDSSIEAIRFYGRYMAIKLLELYRRLGLPLESPDTRPKGGWSPRRSMGLFFYPEKPQFLNRSEDELLLHDYNETVNLFLTTLQREYDLSLSYFQVQVLLCEYRELVEIGRYYPGRSHDEQLETYWKIEEHWGKDFLDETFPVRRACFPHEHLGELQGWQGIRKPLGRSLKDYGYVWSDLLFCFNCSRLLLDEPIQWKGCRCGT